MFEIDICIYVCNVYILFFQSLIMDVCLLPFGCCNNTPQTGLFMNNRNVCPTLPKAGKSLLKTETDSVSGEDLLPGSQMTISLPCLHVQKRTRELSGVSFKRTLILVTDQRLHLQIPTRCESGFNIWIWVGTQAFSLKQWASAFSPAKWGQGQDYLWEGRRLYH